jgi:RNA polymerase sigma-70 factor (ECF subfamily)
VIQLASTEGFPSHQGSGDRSASETQSRDEGGCRFRAMVEAHFDFIWRTLRGLGVSSAGADDAAQQVFLVALQKLDSIEPGRERAFLFSTAVGVAANTRRAQGRVREVHDDEAMLAHADAAPDPEEVSSRRQARARLDAILDAMPIDLRTVFVLFELEALTMAEIATLLDLAPGTVASRLRRAREDFRASVERARAPAGSASARGKGGAR